MKNIVLLGCNGQLGKEIQTLVPTGYQLLPYSRADIDVCDAGQLAKICDDQAALVINASAYTAVDQAESEPANAYAANANAVELIGQLCAKTGARLIHVSTDFVFDGEHSQPYQPTDTPNPQSVYGASKLQGEEHLAAITGLEYHIIRTSWVHSANGNNFVKTMLRLFQQRDTLSVVSDQLGSPTWAHNLAEVIWAFVQQAPEKGIYHYADAGVISWYDFAVAIQQESIAAGWPDNQTLISPIPATSYPTPATRPAYSALNCQTTEQALNISRQPWRDALRCMLLELKAQQ